MKQTDIVRTLVEFKTRIERLESSVGRAGLLQPYEHIPFALVESEETVKAKKPEPLPDLDETKLIDMSHTELVLAAHQVGFPSVTRRDPPEYIIRLILGEADDSTEDPLAEIRARTFDFVERNRKAGMLLLSEMKCSLHCPTCPHHKVVECYTDNHDLVDPKEP